MESFILLIVALFLIGTIVDAIKNASQKRPSSRPRPSDDRTTDMSSSTQKTSRESILDEISRWIEGQSSTQPEEERESTFETLPREEDEIQTPFQIHTQVSVPESSLPSLKENGEKEVTDIDVLPEQPELLDTPEKSLSESRTKEQASVEELLAEKPFLHRAVLMNEILGTPLALKKRGRGRIAIR